MYCGLSEISLPAGLTEISDQMLSGCNFSSFDIPYGITRIGAGAFVGCNLSGGVTIPDSVTYIGRNAFAMSGFESIGIPDSVTVIDGNPFTSNVELAAIDVSSNNPNFSVVDGLLYNDMENR